MVESRDRFYNLTIQLTEHTTWPDGSRGFVERLDDPEWNDADNKLIIEALYGRLAELRIGVLKCVEITNG